MCSRRSRKHNNVHKRGWQRKSSGKEGFSFDFCVIGGGAAGLAAAVCCAREDPDKRVAVLEKQPAPAQKIRATGNGRCNLTNTDSEGYLSTLSFFATLGVETMEEEAGRIYPLSESAADVAEALVGGCRAEGVEIITSYPAETLVLCGMEGDDAAAASKRASGAASSPHGAGFLINGEIKAAQVLIACGGKAGPSFGCTGDGYRLARSLGHSVAPVYPVLTGLEAKGMEDLQGVRLKARAELLRRGVCIASESGEIQFARDGLSGICIMNLSRFVRIGKDTGFGDYAVRILPAAGRVDLAARRAVRGLTAGDLLRSVLPRRAAHHLLQKTLGERALSSPARLLSDEAVRRIEALLCGGWVVPLCGARGWKQAQCSGGGVPLSEVEEKTMASRLVPGLYFAGEVLDYNGPCGGFNLNHAWQTGMRAGTAAGRKHV